jgi:hypothetical protein
MLQNRAIIFSAYIPDVAERQIGAALGSDCHKFMALIDADFGTLFA